MSSRWLDTTLGEVCSRGGVVQTGPFGSQLHAEDYSTVGFPVIMPVNIGENRIEESGIARVSAEHVERLSRHKVRAGDIVYSRRGDITRRALIREHEVGWLCGTGCLLVRPGEGVDPQWLSYWLGTPFVHDWLIQRAVGATMPNLNTGILSELPVSLPALDEQRRIAGVLGALDDLVEVNRGLMRNLRTLALVQYEEMASKATETRRLGDLVFVNARQTKPSADGLLTYLDIASVGDGVVDWPSPVSWHSAPSRARRLAPAGSTVWSTVRPNRRAHALLTHVPNNLVVSTGFAVLEPDSIGPAEIFCATDGDDFVEYLMSRAEGSAYPAVRGSVFEEAKVPFLGKAASKRFEEMAWPLLHAAGELDLESRQLEGTRDELLPLLMSGRLSVDEVAAA